MEVDSGFHSLQRNLRLDDHCLPPKAWESIASESGSDMSSSPAQPPRAIYDICAVSEASLVRLVINALQGVKSAIVEIDKLSLYFCSIPADRTFNRVPSLWCRSSSTHALGNMLKEISHTGLLFFLLRKFVDHYLRTDRNANLIVSENSENFLIQPNGEHRNKIATHSSYGLVNQAFAVAIAKLLDAYICALSTLSASVALRRSTKRKDESVSIKHCEGILSSVVHSDITVLEVYLHSKELRACVEVLGNICFSPIHKSPLSDGLTCDSVMEFHNFPKGAELLTYLYVQLRDADACHHSLLKYLFVHSYEPYCFFVKSWMYRAKIDDPYGEFFIVPSDSELNVNSGSSTVDKFSLATIKERSGVSIPSFLKVACHQLLRAGQQLQVLVKLLDLCSLSLSGEHASYDLSSLRQILPFWVDSSSNLNLLSNPLTFEKNAIESLIQKRETMYRSMLEKLQFYFQTLNANDSRASHDVFTYGSTPMALGRRNGLNVAFSTLSSRGENTLQEDKHVEFEDLDSLSTTSSSESSNELELSHSLDKFSSLGFNNDCRPESYSDNSVFKPSKSMFLNLPACSANQNVLQSYSESICSGSHPLSYRTHREQGFPSISPSDQHYHFRKSDQVSSSLKHDAVKPPRQSESISEDLWSGKCWPLGGLMKNPFSAYMEYSSMKELCSTECDFENAVGTVDYFRGDEMCLRESFGPMNPGLNGLRGMQTSGETFGQSYQLTSSDAPYAFGVNPLLVKVSWLPTVRNLRERRLINNYASSFQQFSFTSVKDPCKLYLESLSSTLGYESMADASMTVQPCSSAVECKEYSGGAIRETLENQTVLASPFISGETNLCTGGQETNASGGSDWATLLLYPVKSSASTDKDNYSEEKFGIPLDIIIDKCILQEILLQYKYISCFTIKLLEEGFRLQEHLLALRRYHFMEISDWADLFVMSLRSQKWPAVDHKQGAAKFQGFLDLALQRSSCENDPYKERLFIYVEEQNVGQPVFTVGIHAFDLMMLGYRVDWPVNIVVTHDALKIYANIFSYLIQIKLAVASLTDVWHYLKALAYSWKDDRRKTLNQDFNMLTRMRQQINHFTCTLQHYVQYQLSDVSWCRFQASLKHMVKDMLDLESVHMLYLADAAKICFLSDDAKEVATVVQNILQCAVEFRLCFGDLDSDIHLNEVDQRNWRSQINFTKVYIVKKAFENNLKELYVMYLKSPKHREFSLSRFWNLLDYSQYYSSYISS